MHEIWERAKNDDFEGLKDEEKQLAKIMLQHEDEYFNQFEFSDVTNDHEYDPDTEENPFLHIYIHSIVENQLREKEPIEVFQFYNAMRNKKCSHHDTLHLIGAILLPLIFDVLKQQSAFDVESYRSLLKKYKKRKPEKIWKLLNSESV